MALAVVSQRHRLTALCLTLITLVCVLNSIPLQASILGILDFERVATFSAASQYQVLGRKIGRVDILFGGSDSFVSSCTGSLITKEHLLVAAHCLLGENTESAILRLGFLSLDQPGVQFKVDLKPLEFNRVLGYSIHRVTGNLTEFFSARKLNIRAPIYNEPLFLLHHPQGEPLTLSRKNCRVVGFDESQSSRFYHSCDSKAGSSGGLLFGDSDGALVGLHIGSVRPSLDTKLTNFALPMETVLKESHILQQILEPKPERTPIVAKLIAELDSADHVAKERAILAIAELKQLPVSVAPPLLKIVATEQPSVAEVAAETLQRLRKQSRSDFLTLGLRTPEAILLFAQASIRDDAAFTKVRAVAVNELRKLVRNIHFARDTAFVSVLKETRALVSSPPELSEDIELAVEHLELLTKTNAKKARLALAKSGTGVSVGSNGHLLTNQHVVEDCLQLIILDSSGEKHEGRVVASDPSNDLALLASPLKGAAVALFESRVLIGEEVYTYGYPLLHTLGREPALTSGIIARKVGKDDDIRYLQFTNPIQNGNSGGPLLNTRGGVVGLITGSLGFAQVLSLGGDAPQNVNFAIKSNIIDLFLDSHRIKTTSTEEGALPDGESLADWVERFTYAIECWN